MKSKKEIEQRIAELIVNRRGGFFPASEAEIKALRWVLDGGTVLSGGVREE